MNCYFSFKLNLIKKNLANFRQDKAQGYVHILDIDEVNGLEVRGVNVILFEAPTV